MAKPYAPDVEIDNTGEKPVVKRASNSGTTTIKRPDTFDLRVQFNFAIASRSRTIAAVRAKYQHEVEEWIEVAEDLYDAEPALKVEPIWNWDVPETGRLSDNTLEFKNAREQNKWLDEHFDNLVGASKDEGCMQVLIVDSLKAPDDGDFASAFFPHTVRLTSRKHGLVTEYSKKTGMAGVLAHELGHVLSLKHTFANYSPLRENCNKDYGKDLGSTKTADGRYNIMDYWPLSEPGRPGVTGYFLNDCQSDRAAKQRRVYSTKDGDVNYRKLKGAR